MPAKRQAAAAAADTAAGTAGPALKRSRSSTTSAGGERSTVPRSPAPRTKLGAGTPFRALSWNICTMRSLLDKHQGMLQKLVADERPDLLCLQETKLKVEDQAPMEARLRKLLQGYSFHWTSSTQKKGYAGSLAITKDEHAPLKVTYGLPTLPTEGVSAEANGEGRTITLEYPKFYVVATYVPNSGQDLGRLKFRCDTWDRRMADYLLSLETKKPTLWCGDLNVAHQVADIYNAGGIEGIPPAAHLEKTAGCTKAERKSFSQILELGFADTFRQQHPEATGWYTYWSVRARNLSVNRGLRLDYFVAGPGFVQGSGGVKVVDSAILPEYCVMDHCPVACSLQI
eukprot:TRINITY_DN18889_c0_g1_i1.p1 TRINITY_DN18889_c0_g1~~TRINITY_DN18889_c0_g1_i1.p1  ORF type:complete len:372 (+),score=123.51 TRINITY_DN18889_c0_g1_i1:92-1117(+)